MISVTSTGIFDIEWNLRGDQQLPSARRSLFAVCLVSKTLC